MRRLRSLACGVVLSAALASTACAAPAGGRLYVRVGPPAPIVERAVVAPGPGYVWIPGFYRWDGAAYVWVRGRWDRPPRPRARWIPGHWAHERGGWYFIEGHWR
jgi:hypothetical protein